MCVLVRSDLVEMQIETSNDTTVVNGNLDWPQAVRCEMNVPEWEKALKNANLLPEYQDVLEGFLEGFDQGIPQHRVGNKNRFIPPNHASAQLAKEKIETTIQKEIEAKRMYGPFEQDEVNKIFPFYRTNPLGAVVNGDGSVRPINDLSFPHNDREIPSVNSFVDSKDFETTWDDFVKVSIFFRNLKEPVELALFDWEKAYRQIPTAPNQWPYLMVKDFEDKILLDTRITFGGVAGCGSFGRPADAWKLIMKHEFDVLEVFRWVDDNLFIKIKDSAVTMDHIVARSNVLGVKTNETKISHFQLEQKFIGFIWNGSAKTVRLPENKRLDRIRQVKVFLEPGHQSSFKEVEVLAGQLNHVSFLLPQLRCYMCSVYRWLKNWFKRKATRFTPQDVLEDLNFWHDTLTTFQCTRLIASPEPTEINWAGDASSSYGIGVLIGQHWTQLKVVKGWETSVTPNRTIAWLETVAIRIGLLMLRRMKVKKGRTLIVWTDNTTSENLVHNRKSKDRWANEEWKKIQSLLVDLQIDIVAKRVTSEENPADGLSRGVRTGHKDKDFMSLNLPDDLSLFLTEQQPQPPTTGTSTR
jgi:hypothetical protein